MAPLSQVPSQNLSKTSLSISSGCVPSIGAWTIGINVRATSGVSHMLMIKIMNTAAFANPVNAN